MMTDIRFKKNKKAKYKGLILSGFSILVSILMIVIGIQINKIPIIVIFTLFLIIGLYLIYKSILNQDTVIVDKKGITSITNGMGLVKWEYIVNLKITKAINSNVLVIEINNEEKLLAEMNNISKQLMKTNIKRLGSPVIIPESEFNTTLEDVIKRIEKYKNSL